MTPTLGEETREAIADLLRGQMRRDPLPGLSVAVVTTEGIAYVEGFGSRDLAGNRPATGDTLYGIGSVTKSFVGLAILQLQEAGMLHVDDPVTDHLDLGLGDDVFEEPIRLRHLLTHSSGFPSLGVSEELLARRLRLTDTGVPMGDRDDLHAHIADAAAGGERVSPPGDRFAYFNTGYGLLGEVIEEATGKHLASYIDEHVFEPVGMDRATFDDTEFARDDDHMTQYLIEDGEPTAASLPTRELSQAAGGILTSVRELGSYLRVQLNGGQYEGTSLVRSDLLKEAHRGRMETPSGAYGYGWRIRETCDRDLIGHFGSIAVSSAYAGFCPDEGYGIALAANSSPSYPLAVLGQGVFALLLGRNPHEAVPFFERRRVFECLTGRYESFRGIKRATVRRDGEMLRLEFGGALGGEPTPLVPAEEGDRLEFYALDSSGNRRPAEFRTQDGRVELLIDRWRFRKQDHLSSDVE